MPSSHIKENKLCAFDLELCNKLAHWLLEWYVNTVRESCGRFTAPYIQVRDTDALLFLALYFCLSVSPAHQIVPPLCCALHSYEFNPLLIYKAKSSEKHSMCTSMFFPPSWMIFYHRYKDTKDFFFFF